MGCGGRRWEGELTQQNRPIISRKRTQRGKGLRSEGGMQATKVLIRRPGLSPPPPAELPSERWRDLILRFWRIAFKQPW